MAPRASTVLKELEALRLEYQRVAWVMAAARDMVEALHSGEGGRIAAALGVLEGAFSRRPRSRYTNIYKVGACELAREIGAKAAARRLGCSLAQLNLWLTRGDGVLIAQGDGESVAHRVRKPLLTVGSLGLSMSHRKARHSSLDRARFDTPSLGVPRAP